MAQNDSWYYMFIENIQSFYELWGSISFIYLCLRRHRRAGEERRKEGRKPEREDREEEREETRREGRGMKGRCFPEFCPMLCDVVFDSRL